MSLKRNFREGSITTSMQLEPHGKEFIKCSPLQAPHSNLRHEQVQSDFEANFASDFTEMALLPYIIDELRPRRLTDQLFGLSLTPEDFLTDIIDRPVLSVRRYMRPWRNMAAAVKDIGSTIKTDKDKFQVNLDVQHFAPEEISVKTSDGFVVIEGKHEEKQDEHGYISRQFTRRYALPEGCNPETVESRLSSDGVLTVIAPKSVEHKDERAVPITQTGPVRRKAEDEANGEIEHEPETKTPQKKRRR